jgi:hypothetical protein
VAAGESDSEIETTLRAEANGVNAEVSATVDTMIHDKQQQLENPLRQRAGYESNMNMEPDRKLAKRAASATQVSLLGWADLIFGWSKAMIFVFFGGVLFAYLIHKAGVSLAYTQYLWLCIVAVSPVWMTSEVLHRYLCMPKEHAEREVRIQRAKRLAIFLFLVWAVFAVIGYVGVNGGIGGSDPSDFDGLLDVGSAPVSEGLVAQFYDVLDQLFGGGVVGTIALILHLMADVLLAGSLLASVDHDFKKSRSHIEVNDASVTHGRNQIEFVQSKVSPLQAELASLAGLRAHIDGLIEAHVASSLVRVQALRARNARMRAVGQSVADEMFAAGKDVTDLVIFNPSELTAVMATHEAATPGHSIN